LGLTDEELGHLEKLAKIELTAGAREKLREQLERIIEFVEQLPNVDATAYDAVYNGNELKLSLRPDEAIRCLPRDEVLAEAPGSIDGYFTVPAIIDSKDG